LGNQAIALSFVHSACIDADYQAKGALGFVQSAFSF